MADFKRFKDSDLRFVKRSHRLPMSFFQTPTMRTALLLVGFLAICTSLALAREAREQARIDFLLRDVETARGIVFVRNGGDHDGASAVKHLRMKLSYAGDRVQTAEDFIKYCASESSLTHQKYKVRLADGKTIDAADYFAGKLRAFDREKQ